MVMRYEKVFRSLSKFVLHPLIHTLLEFNLAQNVESIKKLSRSSAVFFEK